MARSGRRAGYIRNQRGGRYTATISLGNMGILWKCQDRHFDWPEAQQCADAELADRLLEDYEFFQSDEYRLAGMEASA